MQKAQEFLLSFEIVGKFLLNPMQEWPRSKPIYIHFHLEKSIPVFDLRNETKILLGSFIELYFIEAIKNHLWIKQADQSMC